MLETGWALFFGDNLDALRERIPDGYGDLIYLDASSDGAPVRAQTAFEDTWSWDQALAEALAESEEQGGETFLIQCGISGW